MGFPFILFSAARYIYYMISEASKITGDSTAMDVFLNLRHVWAVGYFLAVMLSPRFACEFVLAEVPLLVGTTFEIYHFIVNFESASFLRLSFLTLITGGLFALKKRHTWKNLLNFWRKNDDEFKNSIVDSSV